MRVCFAVFFISSDGQQLGYNDAFDTSPAAPTQHIDGQSITFFVLLTTEFCEQFDDHMQHHVQARVLYTFVVGFIESGIFPGLIIMSVCQSPVCTTRCRETEIQ